MQHIELDDETARNLTVLAESLGLTVEDYLRSLVPATMIADAHALDELEKEWAELALRGPSLPHDFSRADIYEEHD
ncbi:MAG TPA: hypothetical protein VND64_20495 [Pirellulales bacterium]|nr:hypothetical protein [Pirellulales bacterium]